MIFKTKYICMLSYCRLIGIKFALYKQIAFNNPIKAYISKEKCFVSIQTRTTQFENNVFLIEKMVLVEFSKVIGVQNLFDRF